MQLAPADPVAEADQRDEDELDALSRHRPAAAEQLEGHPVPAALFAEGHRQRVAEDEQVAYQALDRAEQIGARHHRIADHVEASGPSHQALREPDRTKHRLRRIGHATPVPGWRPCKGETIVSRSIKQHLITSLVVAIGSVAGATANADVVCDWNATAGDIVVASKPPAAISYRTMAIVQSAVYEAVNAITRRYPPDGLALNAAPGASDRKSVV